MRFRIINAAAIALLFVSSLAGAEILAITNPLFEHLGPSCEQHLSVGPSHEFEDKLKLIMAFQKFRVGVQPGARGFYLETRRPSKNSQTVDIELPAPKNLFWKTEIWSTPTERVRFFSLGFQNLAKESNFINEIVANHILGHPDHSLRLNYDSMRSLLERVLVHLRWYVHDAVVENYKERKIYLSPEEMTKLIAYNEHSTHNDVFALMAADAKPVEMMRDYEELKRNLLMTIQNSYFGTQNFLEPTLKGVLQAKKYAVYEGQDLLPFGFRIPERKREEFLKRLYSRFKPEETGELNRYVRFARFSKPLQERFLLESIETMKWRKKKTILADADRKTYKIFGPEGYGFEKYAVLPTERNPEGLDLPNDDTTEYLLFMPTDGPAYANFHNKLAIGSADVTVRAE